MVGRTGYSRGLPLVVTIIRMGGLFSRPNAASHFSRCRKSSYKNDMISPKPFPLLIAPTLISVLALSFTAAAGRAEPIDFNRDVRPIISDRCFACHGFDEHAREADLRLDSLAGATGDLGGYAAIVPGKPTESALIARITSTDPDTIMPPADSHKKPLTESEIATLAEWIRQGAAWSEHWSFQKPRKGPLGDDAPHPIDDFVRRRLRVKGVQPSPPAAPHTLRTPADNCPSRTMANSF